VHGDSLPAFSVRNIRQENAVDGTLSEASCLIKQACRLLTAKQVPILLLENTPGILAARDDGVPFQHLCSSLQALGYTVAYRVVHAASWGLPQIRRRLVAVFRRYGDPCDDILATIPACAGSGPCERGCYLSSTQQTGLPHAYCTDIGEDSAFTQIDICPTITASGASRLLAWVEGEGVMLLWSRQLLRLQGFPNDWLAGLGILESAAVRMVGNSMPPPTSRWLGRAVGHHGQAKYTSAEEDGLQNVGESFTSAGWSVAAGIFHSSSAMQALGTSKGQHQVRLSEFPEHCEFVSLFSIVSNCGSAAVLTESASVQNWLQRLEQKPPATVLIPMAYALRALIRPLQFRHKETGRALLAASRGEATITTATCVEVTSNKGRRGTRMRKQAPAVCPTPAKTTKGPTGLGKVSSAAYCLPQGLPTPNVRLAATERMLGFTDYQESSGYKLSTAKWSTALALEGTQGHSQPYPGVCSLGAFVTNHVDLVNGQDLLVSDLYRAFSAWYAEKAGRRFKPHISCDQVGELLIVCRWLGRLKGKIDNGVATLCGVGCSLMATRVCECVMILCTNGTPRGSPNLGRLFQTGLLCK
jgi:hypothetical protein